MINSNKANINEVKQAFKELFKRNSDEILKFMNPKLKESLGIINPNDKGFIQQFKSYLQKVNKIEDLAYVINSNKANVNEVKQAFKELFKRNSDEILEVMSPKLKESLDILEQEKRIINFKNIIDNTNSALYNFIKTQ